MIDAPLAIRSACLDFGHRQLWHDLDLDLAAGEFLAVLGPNGTGKTSLLRAILGEQALTSGEIRVLGEPAVRGSSRIGYIPQQRALADGTPLRARDLVAFGVNGTRWGPPIASRAERAQVDRLLAAVGATSFADAPVGSLSGGEQQRIRVAQSIASSPALLLCDEPLLSLDLANQRIVSDLVDAQRRATGCAVVFVTHDVNPILSMVDRVLYLAGGQFRIGTPDEVLQSDVLSQMYGTPVDVIRSRGRVIVVGGPDEHGVHDHAVHHPGREETP